MGLRQKRRLQVVVAAAEGIQRDALVSLLRAQPDLVVAGAVASQGELQRLLHDLQTAMPGDPMSGDPIPGDRVPLTLVVDAGLAAPASGALLAWLRHTYGNLRCVVLADTAGQAAACMEAGAHAALLKGCLDARLLASLWA